MSGVHTIFDTRRLNNNDDEAAYKIPDVKLQAIHLSRYYALSFLAERGELTPSKND
jgi:hypothetical protein